MKIFSSIVCLTILATTSILIQVHSFAHTEASICLVLIITPWKVKECFFQLMKSGVNQATAWADFLDTFSSQANLFALIECNAGEIIYAQARYKNDHLYGYNKRLQFSGYLLQKLI